jgi:hypothetical protein
MCCRFDSGYVFLSDSDLRRIAEGTGKRPEEVATTYCRRIDLGVVSRLSLREQENKDCVFWINGECSIYEHRPLQCRSFPFWPAHLSDRRTWDELVRECPGVNIGALHPASDVRGWLLAHRRESLL